MAWDPCASSPNITMKARAQVVVIEADRLVSSQRKLGDLTAVGPFYFTSLTIIDYTCFYTCEFFSWQGKSEY